MNVLSLFSNIGVAEAYLDKIGINVVVANEIISRRADLYQKIYPKTLMINGDITRHEVKEKIVEQSKLRNVDLIMATPPCQGMSTAGQQDANDVRNTLICDVIDIVKALEPNYIFIENVPLFFNTSILFNNTTILIPDFIEKCLGNDYIINKYIIDTKHYSVPQTRERAIMLISKKRCCKEWIMPKQDKTIKTMYDAIGHLPILDPFIKDISEAELLEIFPKFYERKEAALNISKWHNPPHHIKRQVLVMQHTPTGKSAFDNPVYYPVKADGKPVKGYRNTYKRQNWDTPAYTVTMDNRKISSQNNVHPGRLEKENNINEEIYTDARALTVYELMKVMSLPDNWPIPLDTPEAFLRSIIGEGIPPLFVKKVFENLELGE